MGDSRVLYIGEGVMVDVGLELRDEPKTGYNKTPRSGMWRWNKQM